MTLRVLCISELGAGAGHLAPLMAIATQMRQSRPDIDVVFAVRDPAFAVASFGDSGFSIYPCPSPIETGESGRSLTGSFHETLAFYAFHRADRLAARLGAWDALFDLLQPDIILADHSPTACLAARGRIPVALVGSGYTMPPAHMDAYPALQKGVGAPRAQQHMLETLNGLMQKRAQPGLAALPALLDTAFRGVFAVPQTDVYGALRRDALLGSYNGKITPLAPNPDGCVFLYASLPPDRLGAIVEASVGLGRPLEAYIGPFESAERRFLESFGIQVHHEMPDLSGVLARAHVIVSTAGAGLTMAALMAGRAQLCLPIHIESEINANHVTSLNAGQTLFLDHQRDELAQTLRTVVEVQSFTRNAQDAAQKIAATSLPDDPVDHVAQAVVALG